MQSATPQDNTVTQPAPRVDVARTYGPAVLLGLAFLWLFWRTILNMTERWEEPAFSHGWIVVPAALVIAWYKRDTWLSTPARPANSGLAVIVFGLLVMVLAAWANVNFLPYIAMLIVLGGLILFFGGWGLSKKLAFPYAFLYFMVPWPDFLIEVVSFPMQIMTSIYGTMLARIVGVPVIRDGVNLHIPPPVGADFEVAVACSGMHSLIALLCLAAGFAYFTPVAMWKRWLLFGIGLPMALLANIVRVFAILGVANWISPDLASKAFHDWSSPVLFLLCTMGLMSIRNLMLRESPAPALAGPGAVLSPEEDDAF